MLTHTHYQKIWACFSWCKTEILKYQFRKTHKGRFFFPAKLNFHLGELSAIQMVSMREDEDRHHLFFSLFLPGTTLQINLKSGPFREDLFQEIPVLILQRWLAQLFFHTVLLIFLSPQLDIKWLIAFRTFYFSWNISHCALWQWIFMLQFCQKVCMRNCKIKEKKKAYVSIYNCLCTSGEYLGWDLSLSWHRSEFDPMLPLHYTF